MMVWNINLPQPIVEKLLTVTTMSSLVIIKTFLRESGTGFDLQCAYVCYSIHFCFQPVTPPVSKVQE